MQPEWPLFRLQLIPVLPKYNMLEKKLEGQLIKTVVSIFNSLYRENSIFVNEACEPLMKTNIFHRVYLSVPSSEVPSLQIHGKSTGTLRTFQLKEIFFSLLLVHTEKNQWYLPSQFDKLETKELKAY
jgi:hypothetical protein